MILVEDTQKNIFRRNILFTIGFFNLLPRIIENTVQVYISLHSLLIFVYQSGYNIIIDRDASLGAKIALLTPPSCYLFSDW